MNKILLFCFFLIESFYLKDSKSLFLTYMDSVLYSVDDYFKKYVGQNPNYKIYEWGLLSCIENKKDSVFLTSQKILILSILCKLFIEGKCISKKILKNKVADCFDKIYKEECLDEEKCHNKNNFLVFIIKKAYSIFNSIEGYNSYCLSVAPDWFSKEAYFENNVEYKGPNLKLPISNMLKINEKRFGPEYLIFVYALTNMVKDNIS